MFDSIGMFYSYGGIPVLALQIGCAVHAIKTGRAYWWLLVIFFAPVVGSLIYFFVEVLPDLRHSGGKVASGLAKTINPKRDLKRRADEVALTNTIENKLRLGEEYLQTGHYQEAVTLYESCLNGVYKNDPKVMLGLAEAQFHLKNYAQTKDVLDQLIAATPHFKSPEAHLLYARAVEELGDTDAAFEEYRVLAGYYPGVEAKCRYALLLKQAGRHDEARELFNEIVLSAKKFRRFYKGDDKRWVETARENLTPGGA